MYRRAAISSGWQADGVQDDQVNAGTDRAGAEVWRCTRLGTRVPAITPLVWSLGRPVFTHRRNRPVELQSSAAQSGSEFGEGSSPSAWPRGFG